VEGVLLCVCGWGGEGSQQGCNRVHAVHVATACKVAPGLQGLKTRLTPCLCPCLRTQLSMLLSSRLAG
jgi:hypothetical protein